MTTKQLRAYLREASFASTSNRIELLARYHSYQRRLLQDAGMSVLPEAEDVEDKATSNLVLVMVGEETSNRYMRLVSQKGLDEERDMIWLVHDTHEELKAWGRPGGPSGKLIFKSDAEKSMIALREAPARLHGGLVTPEQPPKGEHASN